MARTALPDHRARKHSTQVRETDQDRQDADALAAHLDCTRPEAYRRAVRAMLGVK